MYGFRGFLPPDWSGSEDFYLLIGPVQRTSTSRFVWLRGFLPLDWSGSEDFYLLIGPV
jgi:hypothetical protein